MSRFIALVILTMNLIVFSSPETKAQNAIFRETQDAAMAAAEGPEFVGADHAELVKSVY
jgi:hypothetical protein